MEERLREMFREEMSAEKQPPLGGLVEGAVRDGRRARRHRRTWIAAASTGVAGALAVTAFVTASGNPAGPAAGPVSGNPAGPERGPTAPLWGQPVLAASSTSTAIKQPPGPKLPVTDAAVIEQVARLLPHGRTSGYAGGPKEKGRYAFGQIYLDTGHGPDMIRAFVYKGGLSAEDCKTKLSPNRVAKLNARRDELLKAAKTPDERRHIQVLFKEVVARKLPGCRDLSDGGRARVDTDPKTGESMATVDHGNGVTVLVYTWTGVEGKDKSPGTIALSPAQVLKIAAYPGWGARMDEALVRKAATDYPSLPTADD